MMDDIRIVVGASFMKRFVAYILDSIPVIILVTLGQVQGEEYMVIIAVLLFWPYFAFMESSSYQGTLGKRLLKMKVTDMKGNRISFGRASGRYFGKCLSSLFMNMGFIIALFSKRIRHSMTIWQRRWFSTTAL